MEEQTNGLVVVSLTLSKDHVRQYKINVNLRIEDGTRIINGLRTYVFNIKFFPTQHQTAQFEQIVDQWDQAWKDIFYITSTTEDGREVEVINTESRFLRACACNVVANPEAVAELEQSYKTIKASLIRLSDLLVLLMDFSLPIQTLANLARPLVFLADSLLILAREMYSQVLSETWANAFPGQEKVLVHVTETRSFFPVTVANFFSEEIIYNKSPRRENSSSRE